MVAQDSEHLKFASLHLKMAVLFKWFGMVLFALACLAICPTEAKCRGKAILTELEGSIESGPDICEWLIKGTYAICLNMYLLQSLSKPGHVTEIRT